MDSITYHTILMIEDTPFEIIEEGNGEHVNIDEANESTYGLMCAGTQKIYLHKELPEEMKRHTLIHEMTHAFLWMRGQYDVTMGNEAQCGLVASLADKVVKLADMYFDCMKDIKK